MKWHYWVSEGAGRYCRHDLVQLILHFIAEKSEVKKVKCLRSSGRVSGDDALLPQPMVEGQQRE